MQACRRLREACSEGRPLYSTRGIGNKCKHAEGCDNNAKNGGLCAKHGGTQAGPQEEQQEDDDEDDDEDD